MEYTRNTFLQRSLGVLKKKKKAVLLKWEWFNTEGNWALQETKRRINGRSTLIGKGWPQNQGQVSPGHGRIVCTQRVSSVGLTSGLGRFCSPYFPWMVAGNRKWGHRKWWDWKRKEIVGEKEAEWTRGMGCFHQPSPDPLYWLWNVYSPQVLKRCVYI